MKKELAGLVILLSLIGPIGQVNATAGDYNLRVSGTVVEQPYISQVASAPNTEYNLTIAIHNEGEKALMMDRMEIFCGALHITSTWYPTKIVSPGETLKESFETYGWASSIIDDATKAGQNYWKCKVKIFDNGNYIGTAYSTTIPIDIPSKGIDLNFVSDAEKLSPKDANLVRCLTDSNSKRKYDGLTTEGVGIRYEDYYFYTNVTNDKLRVKLFWKLEPNADTNSLTNALKQATAQSKYTTFDIGPNDSIESTSYVKIENDNCDQIRSAFTAGANDILDATSSLSKYIADY